LSDEDAINAIRSDKIDIIIDLMGITSNHRLVLFKNRIAKKQLIWCGYCNTTGIDEMDYIISDRNLILQNEEKLYSEKILYMENIWNCHVGYDGERQFYDAPMIKNKYITFGSFNNFRKINNNVINVWSSILKKIDNAKLILKASDIASVTKISKEFEKKGVLKMVEFQSHTKSLNDHLNKYKNIDIALDTFPYNGVTTSFEAIWMGVPVLTMKGFNFNSRCGESINKNLDLEELIAVNEKDYVEKAISLTENDKILNLRKFVFNNCLKSPLFNKNKFSKQFFSSLEKIYNQ
jgi:predicted O-linked N-acetylglucosamine transferase (SPINDLY family)